MRERKGEGGRGNRERERGREGGRWRENVGREKQILNAVLTNRILAIRWYVRSCVCV